MFLLLGCIRHHCRGTDIWICLPQLCSHSWLEIKCTITNLYPVAIYNDSDNKSVISKLLISCYLWCFSDEMKQRMEFKLASSCDINECKQAMILFAPLVCVVIIISSSYLLTNRTISFTKVFKRKHSIRSVDGSHYANKKSRTVLFYA
jgi:hypothetical protein